MRLMAGVLAALVVGGCAATVAPTPSVSVSPSPNPTPTPTFQPRPTIVIPTLEPPRTWSGDLVLRGKGPHRFFGSTDPQSLLGSGFLVTSPVRFRYTAEVRSLDFELSAICHPLCGSAKLADVAYHLGNPEKMTGATWFYVPALQNWASQAIDIDVSTDFDAPWELTVTNAAVAPSLPLKVSGHGGEYSPPFAVDAGVKIAVKVLWPTETIEECSGDVICTDVVAPFFLEPVGAAARYGLTPDPPWKGERQTVDELVIANERGLWMLHGPDGLNWSAVIEPK